MQHVNDCVIRSSGFICLCLSWPDISSGNSANILNEISGLNRFYENVDKIVFSMSSFHFIIQTTIALVSISKVNPMLNLIRVFTLSKKSS